MVELRRCKSMPTYCRFIGASSSCRGGCGNPSVARDARIFTGGGGPAPSSHQEWAAFSWPRPSTEQSLASCPDGHIAVLDPYWQECRAQRRPYRSSIPATEDGISACPGIRRAEP